MSVYALPRPAVMPGVARACAGLDVAREVPLFGVENSDLESGVGALAVLESQAASLRLALLAEADRRQIADQCAATGTDAWAAGLTGDTPEAMRGGIRLLTSFGRSTTRPVKRSLPESFGSPRSG